MAWSSFGNRVAQWRSVSERGRKRDPFRRWAVLVLFVVGLDGSADPALALPQQDIADITRVAAAQGRSAEEIARLVRMAEAAEARGLPPETLLDKIREGLAKQVPAGRIEPVLTRMAEHLDQARALLQEAGAADGGEAGGEPSRRALEVLAEALGRGVAPGEVRALAQAAVAAGGATRAERLAYGAKGAALLKEGGVPSDTSVALLTSALRTDATPLGLLDLARDLKVEGRERQRDPARIRELQRAIEQGRFSRDTPRIERPSVPTRPDRPERVERPERIDRPERPGRP